MDLFSTLNRNDVFAILSYCLSHTKVRTLLFVVHVATLWFYFVDRIKACFKDRIKGCCKKMKKDENISTSTDSVVLHNYVKMTDSTEKKIVTVSYA